MQADAVFQPGPAPFRSLTRSSRTTAHGASGWMETACDGLLEITSILAFQPPRSTSHIYVRWITAVRHPAAAA